MRALRAMLRSSNETSRSPDHHHQQQPQQQQQTALEVGPVSSSMADDPPQRCQWQPRVSLTYDLRAGTVATCPPWRERLCCCSLIEQLKAL